MTALADALEAGPGMTCVVGAGGKKTTLYTLADRLERAILTATVRIPIFDEQVANVAVTDEPLVVAREAGATGEWPLGLVAARDRSDRYEGYDRDVVDRLASEGPDVPVLVKADGARTRLLKAPAEHEPRIPEGADTVVPIASVQAVGKPLTDEYVHRPERVAALTGLEVGDEIGSRDIATVLTASDGGLKDVPPAATVVALLNMVDDDADLAVAREIADPVRTDDRVDRVVLTSMVADEPVRAVLE
ncbi:selenium cofactor biosynthesis protein YqeC [Natrarchaeobaculum aegyptiacum]|uniref:Dehydrogenase n=1 Tax=Natrarchaeobaculum aegyptiacum TaxID=745377 RepID=A0A2Z2I049_9EURY|nr:selenium cofactor biosynthesis protein YqeC [Natrarchaeobaculum aegyptiacum]ARS91727.1 dehydrogenase [Natrarchaeobaculum aegyptiacum]